MSMSSSAAKTVFTASFLAALSAASQAAFLLEQRTSAMDVFYEFGGGGEYHPGSNSVGSILLNGDFSLNLNGADTGSGFTEFGTWEAGVAYDLNQQFDATSTNLVGSGDIMLHSFLAGDGFSNISSGAPGNQLELIFTNDTASDFTLWGAMTSEGRVDLNVATVNGWDPMYTAASMGSYAFNGHLPVGQYRLTGSSFTSATGQQSMGSSWSFNMAAVPEPATIAALAMGAAAMMRRRRRA